MKCCQLVCCAVCCAQVPSDLTMARPKSPFVRKLFALRLREELLTELRHIALDRKMPANQLLEVAIEDFVKKCREKKKF